VAKEAWNIIVWDCRFLWRGVWNLESCGILRRVVTLKLTDVSEVCTASIVIALMMEVVRTTETSATFNVTTRRNIAQDSKIETLLCTIYSVELTTKKTLLYAVTYETCSLLN
jgi:hypothetical protein